MSFLLGISGAAFTTVQDGYEAWEAFSDPSQSLALASLKGIKATGRGAETGILFFRHFIKSANKYFLPVAIGVEYTSGAITVYEYNLGKISNFDFYRKISGPSIFAAFTAGGAVIGGFTGGVSSAGAGAVPGALTGAEIGALIAIPVQIGVDYTFEWWYKKFNEEQEARVEIAIRSLYFN